VEIAVRGSVNAVRLETTPKLPIDNRL